MRLWQKIFDFLVVKPFFWLFFSFKASGSENLKGLSGPILIIGNHKSFIDSFALGAAVPLFCNLFPISIMGKTQDFNNSRVQFLQKIGIVKLTYFLFGVFPALKGIGLDSALQKPKEILEEGGIVFIHPEGKVFHAEGIGQFKRGASALALMTNVKILPVVFKTQKRRSLRPSYFVKFGESFSLPQNLNVEQGADYMRDVIVNLYNSLPKEEFVYASEPRRVLAQKAKTFK